MLKYIKMAKAGHNIERMKITDKLITGKLINERRILCS